jgi:hypothetical protein
MMKKYRAKGRGKRNTLKGNWVTIALAPMLAGAFRNEAVTRVRDGSYDDV